MSRTDPSFDEFEAAAAGLEPQFPSELWSLLKTISTQIDEADQRHTGLLQELRDRLATLSQEAEEARANVPQDAVPAYERIESGLAQLAHRIDALDEGAAGGSDVPPPPFALRSATAGLPQAQADDRSPASSSIDPFDVVGDDDVDPSQWTPSDAEALTRVYEESDAALVRTSPHGGSLAPEDSEPFHPSEPPAPSAPAYSAVLSAELPDPGTANGMSIDREWLDQRLSEIALRIEQSLADMTPGLMVDHLGVRFDAFEDRMGTVLGDVATRTDVESLRHLENQLQELATHLEHTERQLGRLDGIEQQLQAVIDHLAADFGQQPAALSDTAASADFKSLASATAEEVALRFASSFDNAGQDHRIEELGSLLRSMIHDRRQSDEQTYTMLDTVQQAMIRLLDRIDAIEMSQMNAQAVPPPVPSAAAPVGARPVHESEFVQDFGAPDHDDDAPRLSEVAERVAVHVPPAHAAVSAAAPASVPHPTPVDKLRQEFIADAQRAKLRAAASADASAEAPSALQTAAGVTRAIRNAPREKPAGAAVAPNEPSLASRKQRLTALALCLVIAVSGAALFLKSRSKPAVPAEPAAVTETLSPAAVPNADGSAPAATDSAGQTEDIDVPAAPKAEGPAAATGSGAGFDLPADQPSPVPAPPAATPPEAAAPVVPHSTSVGGGPVTNEGALGFEGESPSGGEVLEHHRDLEQGPTGQGLTPQGIILQDGGRKPTAREYAHLQAQQNVATLSSRLGTNASRLSPSDLMPEEVAKYSATPISANGDELAHIQAKPASLSVAARSVQTVDVPLAGGTSVAAQPALPPATVGPMSLRLAAANGDPSAAFEVGARLAEGKGTQQNFSEAIVWYQKSAAQGFAQAQYRLGTLYERGLGVKTDNARAQAWYQRAAEQGHVKAMHNLAVLSAGRSTGRPDYTTAARWFEEAANYGLPDSQYNLAVLYENGLGVNKDVVQAFKWYALAGRGGDAEALRRRDALKSQMSADQRLTAENALASFTPKQVVPMVNDARVAGEAWKKRQTG